MTVAARNQIPNSCRRAGGLLSRLRAAYARKCEDTDVPRAKIFPCFRLETQIRRTTVDGGRASLASPVLADQNDWKLELAPFRCPVPHSPSLDPDKPGGGCRRYDCEVPQRSWSVLASCPNPAGETAHPVYSTGRICENLRSNGSRTRTEPVNHTKEAGWGQVLWGNFRVRRGFSRPC